MADLLFHPRLQEDGTMAPSQEADPAETTPAEATPVAQEADTQPQTPASEVQAEIGDGTPPPPSAENVDDGFFKISKNDPYDDIRRLARSNPDFNRRIREFAGRQNRHELDQELSRLRAELAVKDRELRRKDVASMAPEEIETKFRDDPEFAQEYAKIIHEDDDDLPNPEFEAEASYYTVTRADLFDDARDAAMPEWRVKQFEDAFAYCPVHKTGEHGFYDHDAEGRFFEQRFQEPAMARKASFDYFQRVLNTELRQLQAVQATAAKPAAAAARQEPASPPASEAPPPETPASPSPPATTALGNPNPALAKAPVLSPRTDTSAPGGRYTAEDLRNMPIDARIELVEKHGGRKKMIEDGVLYVPGLSEEVHGQTTPR